MAGKISNIDANNSRYLWLILTRQQLLQMLKVGVQQAYTVKSKEITKFGFSKLSIGDPFYAVLTEGKSGTFSLDRYLVVREK